LLRRLPATFPRTGPADAGEFRLERVPVFERVVITGVTGGVGAAAAEALLAAGTRVLGVSRKTPSSLVAHPLFEHLALDLTTGQVAGLPEPWRNAPIIHCAAITADGWNPEIELGIVRMTEAALKLSNGPMVHISSSSVYNLVGPSVRVSEDEADGHHRFLNSYSRGKWQSELVVRSANRNAVILRPHAVYGPGDNTLLPRVRAAMRFGYLPLPNGGRAQHAMTSLQNLSDAIMVALLALETGRVVGALAVNVSDPAPVEIRSAIIGALGSPVKIANVPASVALAAARVYPVFSRGKGEPRITEYAVRQLLHERTYDLAQLCELRGDSNH
jgi:nucleoside-diphosphate-sugar epimerase